MTEFNKHRIKETQKKIEKLQEFLSKLEKNEDVVSESLPPTCPFCSKPLNGYSCATACAIAEKYQSAAVVTCSCNKKVAIQSVTSYEVVGIDEKDANW
jgi:hypothetical protein